MALLFVDGFDHYGNLDITKKWSSIAGSPSIDASNGRRGTGALVAMTSGTGVIRNFTAGDSWRMGCSLKVGALPGAWASIFTLYDAGSIQSDLRVNPDGTLEVTRAWFTLTGAVSALALSVGVTYYIEWKLTIADSIAANSCKVRVNGVDWITVPAGQDLKATSNTTANQLRLGSANPSGSMGGSTYIDDFYVCDASGSTNNDFLGDVRVDTLFPNADGTYSQFTCSTGTSHYALVDETAPNTTDHNESSTAGHKDSYALGNLTALSSTIYGVQLNVAALKDDAGARGLKVGMRSSSTDSVDAGTALTTSQLYYQRVLETDPATTAAWTESGVNAAEALVEAL